MRSSATSIKRKRRMISPIKPPVHRFRVLLIKADQVQVDGKSYPAEALRRMAAESQGAYEYFEATKELFGFFDSQRQEMEFPHGVSMQITNGGK